MKSWKVILLFGLLCTLTVHRAFAEEEAEDAEGEAEDDEDYADADRAHLIVRKYFEDQFGVQGRNLTVYIDIYNAGTRYSHAILHCLIAAQVVSWLTY
jgi:Translocon-associated protein beta (TRAPB)